LKKRVLLQLERNLRCGDLASYAAKPTENSDGGESDEPGDGGSGGGSGGGEGEGDGDGLGVTKSKGGESGTSGGTDDVSEDDSTEVGKMPNVPETAVGPVVNDALIDPHSDKEDASAYVDSILEEPAINHIFKNSAYRLATPLPAWSFSVDFIPSTKYFNNEDLAEMFTILTKAVISVKINEFKVNSGKLMYAGMQHPFVTNANTAGDLQITFAENNMFQVSRILRKIYRWCSHDPEFAVYDSIVTSGANAANTDEADGPAYTLNFQPIFDKFVCDIVVNVYRPIEAHIFDNVSIMPVFVYTYKHCWLKNIANTAIDYTSDDVIDRDAIFTYQYAIGEPYAHYAVRNGIVDSSEVESAGKSEEQVEKSAWSKFKDAMSFEDPYLDRGSNKSAAEKAKGFISPFGDVGAAIGNVFTGSQDHH